MPIMTNNSDNTIVILGDGNFPTAEYTLDIIKKTSCIICCDSSILKLLNYYNTSNIESIKKQLYIVGDMDTLPAEYQKKFSSYLHKDPCQETNDQTKAFMFALKLNPSKIILTGTTGGREDHTLGNISLLADYGEVLNNGNREGKGLDSIEIITDNGIFRPLYNTATIACKKGGQISMFSFDSSVKIKSAGLKYPTDNVLFDMWWKATLNQATGDSFTLTFNHPAKTLLFFAF